ncbi:MAG: histidine kinase [Treponema sp.]|nr:histidine kinase [Treponema sp.]
MYSADYIDITINIINAVICLLILFFAVTSEYRELKRSRIFIRIIIVNIIGLFVIITENIFDIKAIMENTILMKSLVILIPLFGPVILIFYIELILTILKERTVISKTAVYAAYIAIATCIIDIISTIILVPITMYYMTDISHYIVLRELDKWLLFSRFLSFGCIAIGTGLLVAYNKILSKREFITLLSYAVLPITAILIELFLWRLTLINFSITLAILIYYASIQSELSQQIKQKELELTKSKVSIMLSQIQPHFLYNALSAIAQLCDEDPEKAKKATLDFSKYLRSNMESLNDKGLISVEKEIEHVKGYLGLEKSMYREALNVIYNIESGGFMLPPLSIQPIVENAVKHGIGQKEGGGTITISVSETANEFIVSVSDDGAGYNADNFAEESKTHIGINNVTQRLKEQCGGTLIISSKEKIGTNAVIKIPKILIKH